MPQLIRRSVTLDRPVSRAAMSSGPGWIWQK
jgi:hypothetical protein